MTIKEMAVTIILIVLADTHIAAHCVLAKKMIFESLHQPFGRKMNGREVKAFAHLTVSIGTKIHVLAFGPGYPFNHEVFHNSSQPPYFPPATQLFILEEFNNILLRASEGF